MKRKILIIGSMVCFLFSIACRKEDQAQTTLNYTFNAKNLTAKLGSQNSQESGTPVDPNDGFNITWTSIALNVEKLHLQATQGTNTVSFELNRLYAINPLKTDSIAGSVEIPVGTYESVKLNIKLAPNGKSPIIRLAGIYHESGGTKVPVVVEVDDPKEINLTTDKFTIEKGEYIAKIDLKTNLLATGISSSDFGQTTRTSPNNTIVVTANKNTALYNKLLANLPTTMNFTILKK